MYDKKLFKETFAAIKASDNTFTEVLNMTTRKNLKLRHKRIIGVLVAVITVTVLSITALAYSGMRGWIFVDRDPDTKNLSETAQDALDNFTGASKEQNTPSNHEAQSTADKEDGNDAVAQSVVNWFSGQIKNSTWSVITLSDFAGEAKDGTITFYFNPGDDPLYERSITVSVSADGDVTGIDLRAACPLIPPQDCPPEYIVRGTHTSGIEYDHFNSDAYLLEVVYSDTADRANYSLQAEAAAEKAMEQLFENGFISADPSGIHLIYFETFNGGAAWIDVLMENGDVYCLFLQPDDFSILGFDLRTTEQLAAGQGNARLYEALRNGTLEEYQQQQKELIAGGVG